MDTRFAERGLFRMFFGHVDHSGYVKLQLEMEPFRKSIHDTIQKPVLKMLRESILFNVLRSYYAWRVRGKNASADVPMTVMTRTG